MVARGALGYPWIFRESLQILRGEEPSPPSPEERLGAALRHLDLFVGMEGERVAVREMRKHVSWYAKGIPGAARFRNMVNLIEGRETLTQLMHDFFGGSPSFHG
jgi:tRNA-dihydrouridine synthase